MRLDDLPAEKLDRPAAGDGDADGRAAGQDDIGAAGFDYGGAGGGAGIDQQGAAAAHQRAAEYGSAREFHHTVADIPGPAGAADRPGAANHAEGGEPEILRSAMPPIM